MQVENEKAKYTNKSKKKQKYGRVMGVVRFGFIAFVCFVFLVMFWSHILLQISKEFSTCF